MNEYKQSVLLLVPILVDSSDLEKTLKKNGFKVERASVPWKYVGLRGMINAIHYSKEPDLVIGFSIGSFLAQILFRDKPLILCSPSPFFNEDMPNLTKAFKENLGRRKYSSFSSVSRNDIHSKMLRITIVGDTEDPFLIKQAAKSGGRVIVPNASHNLDDFISEIISQINKL